MKFGHFEGKESKKSKNLKIFPSFFTLKLTDSIVAKVILCNFTLPEKGVKTSERGERLLI